MCPLWKFGWIWNISGRRPTTVTRVVSITGLNRWVAARTEASSAGNPWRRSW